MRIGVITSTDVAIGFVEQPIPPTTTTTISLISFVT